MENELVALSNELAGAVEQAGRAAVAVNARPRFASSGVTLPEDRTTSATLGGPGCGHGSCCTEATFGVA
ncbi:MAG: hypothetical protein ABSG65_00510 [Bryobacteraceae bacterium]|jgi:hypothetical protein